jgi:hypothetical protein
MNEPQVRSFVVSQNVLAHDFAVVVKSSDFPLRVDRRIALGWVDQRGRFFGTPRLVGASHGRAALDAV